jgi:CheY-like chemotaxis protein
MARRILVVEDEPAFADVVSELLAEEGYAVVRARDGMTAINMLAAKRLQPDLIVCDVMMPGMRGERVAAEIRKRCPSLRLPIVLMSASADPGVKLRDVTFVSKPFDVREFLSTIEQMLTEQPQQSRVAAQP